MGFVINAKDIPYVERIAQRERAPLYVVGETTDDAKFVFEDNNGVKPIDLKMADMFGNSPKTVMRDVTVERHYSDPATSDSDIESYLLGVLSLEAVACKDWLTNKVDRSVTGRIARQQCQGEIQLPLSDCGVVALDYNGKAGIATSIGHAPQVALVDSAKGSVMAVAESLTNIVGARLAKGLKSVSLSANWMWPCKNEGEDAALYRAVEACSDFACHLGINIPTGKDSLSMTQKYGDDKVFAPGTVIISAAGEVTDVRQTVSPVLQPKVSTLYYIDFSSDSLKLGGSALYQSLNKVGSEAPTVTDADKFATAFEAVQKLVRNRKLLAMHDVSAGGLITTLLEMTFGNTAGGVLFHTTGFDMIGEKDLVKILFAENPAVVIQVDDKKKESVEKILDDAGVRYFPIGYPTDQLVLNVAHGERTILFNIDTLRDKWFESSYLLDTLQSGEQCAKLRYENYKHQPIRYRIPAAWKGSLESRGLSRVHEPSGIKAAIIREKGVNSDREMAYSLYLAGFDVKDVHMTDLMSGRETLDDINLIVFCGGFSNSDVLGSAKGWASGFKWNDTARETLQRFINRPDTLSLGICNGCQLMIELNLINPEHAKPAKMEHNISHKFESQFLGVKIPKNNSVMLGSLSGMKLGVWAAHGEGRFNLPEAKEKYNIVAQYNYAAYPANPNGSKWSVAGIASADGRHLAMMPHPERAMFPWQCGYYPASRRNDDVTPWLDMMVNARIWIEQNRK